MNQRTGRFGFIDGLRGIAALLVVLPHASGLFAFPQANSISHAMIAVSKYGGRGVQLFFVISGFVIAYSLRNAEGRTFSFGNFVLRRSIRLDPPYWASIFVMLGASAIQAIVTHRPIPIPSSGQLLAHLLYLPVILHYDLFNVVYWTLCIEFQLYIVFALFLVITARCSRAERVDTKTRPRLVLAFFIGSVVVAHLAGPDDSILRWFIPYWYMFLAGVMLCWFMLGRVQRWHLLACEAVMIIGFAAQPDSVKLSAILAALVIHCAIWLRKLDLWLCGPKAQLLGKLSYCIYLLHVPVAFLMLGLRTRVAPSSNLAAMVMLVLVYCAVILSSCFLNRTVEVPCLRLSARFKERPRADSAAA